MYRIVTLWWYQYNTNEIRFNIKLEERRKYSRYFRINMEVIRIYCLHANEIFVKYFENIDRRQYDFSSFCHICSVSEHVPPFRRLVLQGLAAARAVNGTSGGAHWWRAHTSDSLRMRGASRDPSGTLWWAQTWRLSSYLRSDSDAVSVQPGSL